MSIKRANTNSIQSVKIGQNKDATPPRTPRMEKSIAYNKANEGARLSDASWKAQEGKNPKGDIYLEFSNFEPGTSIELINLSANPDAQAKWEGKITLSTNGEDSLLPSGVDFDKTNPHSKRKEMLAGFHISEAQAESLNLQPGDRIAFRAIDESGNTSQTGHSEIDPNLWATDTVKEGNNFSVGNRVDLLKGNGGRAGFLARATADTRPPILSEQNISFATHAVSDEIADLAKNVYDLGGEITDSLERMGFDNFFVTKEALEGINSGDNKLTGETKKAVESALQNFDELESFMLNNGEIDKDGGFNIENLQFIAKAKGQPRVLLMGNKAAEPWSEVEITNVRSGEVRNIRSRGFGKMDAIIPGLQDGDTLVMKPKDQAGNDGQPVEIRYDSSAENGRAKPLNKMNIRFKDID